MTTLIGIDVGTSATRAVLIDSDGAHIGTASRAHSVSEPCVDRAEHDAETMWWHETLEVLAELAARYPNEVRRARAIGLSAVGASIVPVDAAGRALRPAILYGIDRRAQAQGEWLENQLGPAEARRRTGREFSTQSVGPKILWVKEHEPEIAARCATYLPPTAFLARRLGAEAVIDPHTALAIHPLFRADRMTWDEEAVRLVCRLEQLPQVAAAGTPIGVISDEVADAVELPRGIQVCCGTGDVLAESVACGAVRPGDTMIMYGSTLFVVHVTQEFEPRPPLWASVYPIGDLSCLSTGTSTAGAAAGWLLGLGGRHDSAHQQALMAQAATLKAADDGLIFLPYLRGERAPLFLPDARGVFFGLTTRHTLAHLYRAVLEGIGFSLRHVFDEMPLASKRILVSGGGSDLSTPLQIAVNALGHPQLRARRGRSAGYGAAVIAGIGIGAIDLDSLDTDFFGGFDSLQPSASPTSARNYALYRDVSAAAVGLFQRQCGNVSEDEVDGVFSSSD